MGTRDAIQEPAIVTGTFLVNNSYAYVPFDSGTKKSFVSHKFKQLLNQNPQTLKEMYTIDMANGRTENTKEIYLNCTLTLNDRTFQINLMPMTIGSFNVIVDMYWLTTQHPDIMCHGKTVQLNLPNNITLSLIHI